MKSVRNRIHTKVREQVINKLFFKMDYSVWNRLDRRYSLETHQQIRDNLRIQIHNQSYEIGIWSNI
jgi:hypothetical protein